MLLKIEWALVSPVIMQDPLHLDALLMAVHPEARSITEVNRNLRDGELVQLDLPIKKARCGDRWVWAASSVELADNAEPYTGTYKKAKDHEDAFYLTKNTMVIGGIHKNWVKRVSGFTTSSVTFYAATDDPDGVESLCRRVSSVGKLRGMGYGQITGFVISEAEGGWQDTLVRDGLAFRNMPACFCEEEATEDIIALPPYWGMYRREPGFAPGAMATLRPEVACC